MVSDLLLARAAAEGRIVATGQLALIIAWHWTVLPATLALIDWWLGYGATTGAGLPTSAPFDGGRALDWFVQPLFLSIYLILFLVEIGFSMVAFRVVTRRRALNRSLFIRLWWRACLWGMLALPIPTIIVGVLSKDYDLAMNLPPLWVLWMIAGPAVLARIHGYHGYPPGFCKTCGYNLTGNTSGRCPECGTVVHSGLHAELAPRGEMVFPPDRDDPT